MTKKRKMSLTVKIIIAMVLGVAIGLIINVIGTETWTLEEPKGWLVDNVANGFFHVAGSIFIKFLKLLVVPLVFASLVCGTAALDDIAKLGRVGGKTFVLYIATTVIAISLAIIFVEIFKPGVGFNLPTNLSFEQKQAPPLADMILDIFPSNPIDAMAQGNMLQIIVFACLFGFVLTLSGAAGKRILAIFSDLNDVIMKMIMVIMEAAPYGVFFLLAKVIAIQGPGAIVKLSGYFALVLFVLLIHAGLTYPLMLKLLVGLNPLTFYKKMKTVLLFGFNTSSSGATMPVTLETAEHKLGVDNSIAAFTIPLGATVNMDGTAIMQGVATGFVAQAYGIHLGFEQYLMVILTATLASIGTAAVPSAGLVMLAMVFNQVNLPTEAIGMVIAVDRFLDMTRTAVNLAGDATVTCIVAKTENQLDETVFNS